MNATVVGKSKLLEFLESNDVVDVMLLSALDVAEDVVLVECPVLYQRRT